jgi:signal transduction histidine kinase
MNLRVKLAATLLCAVLLPMMALAGTAFRIQEDTLRATLGELEHRGAECRAQGTGEQACTARALQAVQEQVAALGSVQSIRAHGILWIGLALFAAVGVGLVLGARLSRPIALLARRAGEVARGHFRARVDTGGRDELARLGLAFNSMCEQIEARNAEAEQRSRAQGERVEIRTRELEEAGDDLVVSRKMAAVSSLSAGVAHEINNPLTGVLGFTQVLLARARAAGSPDAELLVKVEGEALRIRGIVERMLSLDRAEEESFSQLALADVVDHALEQARLTLDQEGVAVGRWIGSDLPDVLGNAIQLEQVVLQLIDNARKAMHDQARKQIDIELTQIEGERVRLAVRDTGHGIPADIRHRVFEPFFTTKDEWRSEGMGLAIAFRVIEAHHGRIRIHSQPGAGTAMIVTLPVARRGAHMS